MCSGALILAALGLLNGLSATTYPTAVEALKSCGVQVENKDLVTHGNIATAAAIDLVGYCIEKLIDADTKRRVLASVQPIGKGMECIY
jgi:transcriptional regulator GlxA family with amidase domain